MRERRESKRERGGIKGTKGESKGQKEKEREDKKESKGCRHGSMNRKKERNKERVKGGKSKESKDPRKTQLHHLLCLHHMKEKERNAEERRKECRRNAEGV